MYHYKHMSSFISLDFGEATNIFKAISTIENLTYNVLKLLIPQGALLLHLVYLRAMTLR